MKGQTDWDRVKAAPDHEGEQEIDVDWSSARMVELKKEARKDALVSLLEMVKVGDESLNLGGTSKFEVLGRGQAFLAASAYHSTDLGAAQALHEAVLPRHYAQIYMSPVEMSNVDIGGGHTGCDDNPARAWLIAIINALIAQED